MEILNNKKNVIVGGFVVIIIIVAVIGGIFILNDSNKNDNINTNEILNIEPSEEKIEENNIQSKIYVHIIGEVVQQRSY